LGNEDNKNKYNINNVSFVVVDDRPSIRKMIITHLKSFGCEHFWEAKSGIEALSLLSGDSSVIQNSAIEAMLSKRTDILEDFSPSSGRLKVFHKVCVITDFAMPYGNGLELTKAIRGGKTAVDRGTPIILLTGHADTFVIHSALQLDVNAFVVKPVSQKTIKDKVIRVLTVHIDIKEAKEYLSVNLLQEVKKTYDFEYQDSPNAKIDDNIRIDDNTRLVPLHSVQPNAVLAADLFSKKGTLVLRANTILNKSLINRLRDLEKMDGLKLDIPVLK